MPGHAALIFDSDGISRCQLPDFINLSHLNIGAVGWVTIDNGTITPVKSYIGALPGTIPPTNQIHTINGGQEGTIIILRCQAAIAVDNTGNLRLAGNLTMNNPEDTLMLLKTAGGTWIELSRSNNG